MSHTQTLHHRTRCPRRFAGNTNPFVYNTNGYLVRMNGIHPQCLVDKAGADGWQPRCTKFDSTKSVANQSAGWARTLTCGDEHLRIWASSGYTELASGWCTNVKARASTLFATSSPPRETAPGTTSCAICHRDIGA